MSVKDVLTLREWKAILSLATQCLEKNEMFSLILRNTMEILNHEGEDEVEKCCHTTIKCCNTTKKSDNTPPLVRVRQPF
jgi:hypothetical protein